MVPLCGTELLAKDEHPTVVAVPDAAGAATVRVEPLAITIALHAENVEETIRIGDGLHSDKEPFVHRLVRILNPKLRSDFGRTLLETKPLGSGEDFSGGPAIFLAGELSRS